MSEQAFCHHCMEYQECRVIRGVGITQWKCLVCGEIADSNPEDDDEIFDQPEI